MGRIDTILNLVGLIPLVLLVVILVRRGLYRRFPAFFAYCMLRALITIPRLIVRTYPTPYFMLYWTTEALYFIVSFAAMTRIASLFLEIASMRHRWPRLILLGGTGLVIVISLLPAVFSPIGPSFVGRFASAVYSFVILMCVAEILLFIVVVRAGRRYVRDLSRYETGILAGFCSLALVTLFADYVLFLRIIHLRPSPAWETMYRYGPTLALMPAVIAWLVAFWRPEPPQKIDPPDLSRYPDLAKVLEERSNVLKEVLKRFGFKLVTEGRRMILAVLPTHAGFAVGRTEEGSLREPNWRLRREREW